MWDFIPQYHRSCLGLPMPCSLSMHDATLWFLSCDGQLRLAFIDPFRTITLKWFLFYFQKFVYKKKYRCDLIGTCSIYVYGSIL